MTKIPYKRKFDYLFSDNTEIVLWGAANIGRRFVDFYNKYLNIVMVCDGAQDRVGCALGNFIICTPESILYQENRIVIVTCSFYSEIRSVLENRGYTHGMNLFNYDDIEIIIEYYQHGFLRSNRIDISLTEKCTFNCKKCNMFMPYFKEPKHQPLRNVLDDIDSYFETVDYVREMELLGGEPFLYPYLDDVIRYVGEVYRHRIKRPTIFTNGAVVPSDSLLKKMREYDIWVMLSDYRAAISYEKKWMEVKNALETYGIHYYAPAEEQWKDFGFPENSNPEMTEGELSHHFRACLPPFRGLYQKKVAFCHLEMSAMRAGIFPYEERDYFDLTTEDQDRKEKYLEFDRGFIDKGYLEFCKVCRGCGSSNEHYVQTAEQMLRSYQG